MKMIILLILITSLLFDTPSFAQSTQEMLSACKSLMTNIKTNGNDVIFSNTFAEGKCWGAFSVVHSIINVVIIGETEPMFRVCAPDESKLTELISVFVKYADDNPQRLHEDFFMVAMNSLRITFPCKKTNFKEQKKKSKQ